jgi:hypothetical protein
MHSARSRARLAPRPPSAAPAAHGWAGHAQSRAAAPAPPRPPARRRAGQADAPRAPGPATAAAARRRAAAPASGRERTSAGRWTTTRTRGTPARCCAGWPSSSRAPWPACMAGRGRATRRAAAALGRGARRALKRRPSGDQVATKWRLRACSPGVGRVLPPDRQSALKSRAVGFQRGVRRRARQSVRRISGPPVWIAHDTGVAAHRGSPRWRVAGACDRV